MAPSTSGWSCCARSHQQPAPRMLHSHACMTPSAVLCVCSSLIQLSTRVLRVRVSAVSHQSGQSRLAARLPRARAALHPADHVLLPSRGSAHTAHCCCQQALHRSHGPHRAALTTDLCAACRAVQWCATPSASFCRSLWTSSAAATLSGRPTRRSRTLSRSATQPSTLRSTRRRLRSEHSAASVSRTTRPI